MKNTHYLPALAILAASALYAADAEAWGHFGRLEDRMQHMQTRMDAARAELTSRIDAMHVKMETEQDELATRIAERFGAAGEVDDVGDGTDSEADDEAGTDDSGDESDTSNDDTVTDDVTDEEGGGASGDDTDSADDSDDTEAEEGGDSVSDDTDAGSSDDGEGGNTADDEEDDDTADNTSGPEEEPTDGTDAGDTGDETGEETDTGDDASGGNAGEAGSGSVLLTEILFDPGSTEEQGTDTNNEWIEVYNGTGAAVDLMGWSIGDGSATDVIAIETLMLPAGEHLIVTRHPSTDDYWTYGEGTVVVHLNATLGSAGLTNSGESVLLYDSEGTIIDAVSWGTDTTAFTPSVDITDIEEGQSIERVNMTDTDTAADWVIAHSPTPGV